MMEPLKDKPAFKLLGYMPVSNDGATPPKPIIERFLNMVVRSSAEEMAALELAELLSLESATALGWCLVANRQWQAFTIQTYDVSVSLSIVKREESKAERK